ncbi:MULTISPECIES: hypothetical protein [Rhodococcus]|uniref:hypothetical protein n=1 Tax=Rhodococcus TaxID=1827 RepID=UPI000717E730|nr:MULTISPECIES: hypothetical protein [Rhodococcus]MEA1798283.1 hypothetical protein [Rhodococcus qingshengii]
MTAPDFTGWREPWPLTPTLRPLPEPKPVIVETNRALPLAKNATRPDRLPLRVLAGGLRLEGTMPGKLYAWVLLSDGQWLGCVKIHALTGDGRTGLDLWLWVTSDAISSAGP